MRHKGKLQQMSLEINSNPSPALAPDTSLLLSGWTVSNLHWVSKANLSARRSVLEPREWWRGRREVLCLRISEYRDRISWQRGSCRETCHFRHWTLEKATVQLISITELWAPVLIQCCLITKCTVELRRRSSTARIITSHNFVRFSSGSCQWWRQWIFRWPVRVASAVIESDNSVHS